MMAAPDSERLGARGARGRYQGGMTMSDFDETTSTLNFDGPNSYIGRSVTRPNARRLAQGRGQFVDDIVLPRMAHVAYVRSPHAHAKILGIKREESRRDAGRGAHRHRRRDRAGRQALTSACSRTLQGMRSPPQYPLAIDVARWQGEPVVAVVAASRAEAEDAAEAVEVEYEELPAALDAERASTRPSRRSTRNSTATCASRARSIRAASTRR